MIIKALSKIRRRLFRRYILIKNRGNLDISKSATIPETTIIRINGTGKIIIGNNVELRNNVVLNVSNGGCIDIRDNVFINDYPCINAQCSIIIDEDVQIGQGVKIYDHDHDYSTRDFKHHFLKNDVYIGKNTWIGSNAILLRGASIGNDCVIGAGCILKQSIPSNTLTYDNRNKIIKAINR